MHANGTRVWSRRVNHAIFIIWGSQGISCRSWFCPILSAASLVDPWGIFYELKYVRALGALKVTFQTQTPSRARHPSRSWSNFSFFSSFPDLSAMSVQNTPIGEPYIRLAGPNDLEEVSALACRAFLDDPLFNYFGSCMQVWMYTFCCLHLLPYSKSSRSGRHWGLQYRWSKTTDFSQVHSQVMYAAWRSDHCYCHTSCQRRGERDSCRCINVATPKQTTIAGGDFYPNPGRSDWDFHGLGHERLSCTRSDLWFLKLDWHAWGFVFVFISVWAKNIPRYPIRQWKEDTRPKEYKDHPTNHGTSK